VSDATSDVAAEAVLLGETVVVDDVGPGRRGRPHPSLRASSLLLVPATVLVGGLVLWPVGRIVHASLTEAGEGYVGLAHFRAALDRDGVGSTFVQTVAWATVVPLLVTVLGLALAVASRRIATRRRRLVWLALAVLVGPIALPLVVTGVAFRLLYDPDPARGTGSAVLGWLLPGDEAPALLGPRLITVALMSAFVWAWVGLAILVFRRALDRLPPVLVDAVRAHGGGWWAELRHARWQPLLRRTSAIVFALVSLATVRSFDLIMVTAPGSVVDEASVLSVLQWQTSAGETTGPSAALGVLWLLLLLAGVALAAVGSRQSWPAPEPAPRAPAPAASRRRWAPVGGLRWVALRVGAGVAAVLWAVPLLVLVGTSLHDPDDAATGSWWRAPFELESYGDAFAADRGLWRSGILTAVLALSATVVVVVVAALAAYALAWIGAPGAHVAGVTLLGAAVVPLLVIAGPITEVLDVLGLAGTPVALGLVHAALGLPLAVLVLRNALSDLPRAVVREARLEGAREVDVVRRLLREDSLQTALVAVAVLQFVQIWNDFVVGLVFGGPSAVPLGVLVHGEARGFVTGSGPLAAISVLVSVVPVALVGLTHRWLVGGLTGGGRREAAAA
jgi:alpha-glucoside transport system permease protein